MRTTSMLTIMLALLVSCQSMSGQRHKQYLHARDSAIQSTIHEMILDNPNGYMIDTIDEDEGETLSSMVIADETVYSIDNLTGEQTVNIGPTEVLNAVMKELDSKKATYQHVRYSINKKGDRWLINYEEPVYIPIIRRISP
jgi:hypothetical protein